MLKPQMESEFLDLNIAIHFNVSAVADVDADRILVQTSNPMLL